MDAERLGVAVAQVVAHDQDEVGAGFRTRTRGRPRHQRCRTGGPAGQQQGCKTRTGREVSHAQTQPTRPPVHNQPFNVRLHLVEPLDPQVPKRDFGPVVAVRVQADVAVGVMQTGMFLVVQRVAPGPGRRRQ